MVRHTKDQKYDGLPIVRFQPKTIRNVLLNFSGKEGETYAAIYGSARSAVRTKLHNSTPSSSYAFIIQQLNRIRQFCSDGTLGELPRENIPPLTIETRSDIPPFDGLTGQGQRSSKAPPWLRDTAPV